MATKQNADWTAIRLAYINSDKGAEELARDFGVTAESIRQRVSRHKWNADRRSVTETVTKTVTEAVTRDKIDALTAANEANIKVAKALRGAVGKRLFDAQQSLIDALSPQEMSALARTLEITQKVERLALGASTENTELTGKNGQPIPITAVPMEQYLQARERALKEFL